MTENPAPRSLTRATVTAWLMRFGATVRSVEPELTALDQQAGDGDFGVNIATGMDGVRRALDSLSATPAVGEDTAEAPLAAAARVFLDEVGGTSGPLFGLLFQELADAVAAAAPIRPAPANWPPGSPPGRPRSSGWARPRSATRPWSTPFSRPRRRSPTARRPPNRPARCGSRRWPPTVARGPPPICAPGAGGPATPGSTRSASPTRGPWPWRCCSPPPMAN